MYWLAKMTYTVNDGRYETRELTVVRVGFIKKASSLAELLKRSGMASRKGRFKEHP